MADLGLSPSQPKKGDKKKTEVSLQLANSTPILLYKSLLVIKDFDFHNFVMIWNHLENYKHDWGCFKINLRQNGVLHEDVGASHLQSRPPPDPDPSDLFGQRVTSTNIKNDQVSIA